MPTRGGLLGMAAVVLAIAALGYATLPGHAAIQPSLAIDAVTEGNDASQLGPLDACRRVEVGDMFSVDVTITGVTDLHEWEFYLDYDPAIVTLTNYTAMMMADGTMADGSAPGPPYQYFLAFGSSTAASGSGVLARLTFQSNAAGISGLTIEKAPAWPRLSGESGPIGDTNGDGYFDGPTSNAQIVVGQDCPPSPPPTTEALPTMTAPPTPRITRSPGPLLTATPTPWAEEETATPAPKTAPATTPTLPTETGSPSDPPTTKPSTPMLTPSPPSVQGDVTCNGTVDVMDVLATLDEAAHIAVPTTCRDLADVNCDGQIDERDALLILLDVSGNSQQEPASCPEIGASMANFSR